MSLIQSLAKQTVVYGLGTMLPRLLNYLVLTFYYTRIFDNPYDFGIITELYAYVVVLMVILTYGTETAFFKFTGQGKLNTVFFTIFTSLFISTILFVIGSYLFSDHLASLIGYSNDTRYIKYFAVIVGLDVLSAIPFAKLRAEKRSVRFAIIRIVNVMSTIVAVFALMSIKVSVDFVFIANIIGSSITFVLLLPEFVGRKYEFDFRLLRKILAYSLPLLIAGLAGTVNETLDRIIMKHMYPDQVFALKQVGIYGANVKMAVLMTLFIQMFRYAAEPFFFDHHKESGDKRIYSDVMSFFVFSCLLIFLVVVLYIKYFKVFIGVNYHEGLHIVPIVMFSNLLLGIYFNQSMWYKLSSNTLKGAAITVVGVVITFVGNIWLIPIMGYEGSAYTKVACYGAMLLVSHLLSRGQHYIGYDWRMVGGFSFMAILFVWISFYVLKDGGWLHDIVSLGFIFIFIFTFFRVEKQLILKYFNLPSWLK